jgi:hypothetical protein
MHEYPLATVRCKLRHPAFFLEFCAKTYQNLFHLKVFLTKVLIVDHCVRKCAMDSPKTHDGSALSLKNSQTLRSIFQQSRAGEMPMNIMWIASALLN